MAQVLQIINEEDEDRNRLLGIFPEELWMQIFDTLVIDPDTLITLSNASFFWRNLLESRKVVHLFPSVLKVLADNNHITKADRADLLNYRLVCKTWQLGVNRLLENRNHDQLKISRYRQDTSGDISYPTYFCYHSLKTLRTLDTQIIPLLSSRLGQTVNPFPSRQFVYLDEKLSQHIDFPEFEHVFRHRSLLKTFLEKAGHHFWYADISLGQLSSRLEWYEQTCKHVSYLPNLKSLHLVCPRLGHNQDQHTRQLLDRLSFPALQNLELLSLENVPIHVTNSIFTANKQIKYLIIPSFRSPTAAAFLRMHMLQQEMRFHVVQPAGGGVAEVVNRGHGGGHGGGIIQHHQDVLNFSLIRDPHTVCINFDCQENFNRLPPEWKLQKLWLGLENCRSLNLPEIFRKLEFYKNSLVELHLNLPKAITDDDKLIFWESSRQLLHLPKLKTLEVEARNFCSLDFLLGLMSLEYLAVSLKHNDLAPPPRGTAEEIINFNKGYSTRILECNIWTLIPSLKKADVRHEPPSFQRRLPPPVVHWDNANAEHLLWPAPADAEPWFHPFGRVVRHRHE